MTEHSAVIFVFFFLAEYSNIILISTLTVILFLGGYLLPSVLTSSLAYIFDLANINNLASSQSFSSLNILFEGTITGFVIGLKSALIMFLFIWVRASFPRIRYDQLLQVCWMVLLPVVFAIIIFVPSILYSFDLFSFNVI